MKPKVKTSEAATGALRFGASNLGLVVRLYWLPALLFLGAYLGFFFVFLGSAFVYEAGAGAFDPAMTAGWPYQVGSFALAALSLVIFAPASVALARIIAGDMERPAGIGYFRFGGREWRFAGASLLLTLVYYAVTLLSVPAFLFSSSTIASIDMSGMPMTGSSLPWYAIVAIMVAYVWFSVRMVSLLPMTAIENRLAPVAAFRLTAWNFWRIFGAYLMLILILLMLYIGFVICIGIAAMIVTLVVGGLLASLGGGTGEGIALAIVLGIAVLVIYAVVAAFVVGALTYIQTKIYLDLARPKTDQDLIDKLDDTPRKPEDEPDTDDESAVKRDGEPASTDGE